MRRAWGLADDLGRRFGWPDRREKRHGSRTSVPPRCEGEGPIRGMTAVSRVCVPVGHPGRGVRCPGFGDPGQIRAPASSMMRGAPRLHGCCRWRQRLSQLGDDESAMPVWPFNPYSRPPRPAAVPAVDCSFAAPPRQGFRHSWSMIDPAPPRRRRPFQMRALLLW